MASSLPALRWRVLIVDLDPVQGTERPGTRRALVVSYEPFHRSGRLTVCPISAARDAARYPGEVAIPAGEGGQTKPGVILCHQLRTISARRVSSAAGVVTSRAIRAEVRAALATHLGLDIPGRLDASADPSAFVS